MNRDKKGVAIRKVCYDPRYAEVQYVVAPCEYDPM
jgi:hypothetical protein